MAKKEEPRRRSLNALIEAAASEDIDVAGIGTEPQNQQVQESVSSSSSSSSSSGSESFPTKKATTIMPKEVFNALQMYCTQTDTPKHRALYLFILDGLHAAGQISDNDYQRFRDMAALLTTTYEKK
jgi:hypothetical protein